MNRKKLASLIGAMTSSLIIPAAASAYDGCMSRDDLVLSKVRRVEPECRDRSIRREWENYTILRYNGDGSWTPDNDDHRRNFWNGGYEVSTYETSTILTQVTNKCSNQVVTSTIGTTTSPEAHYFEAISEDRLENQFSEAELERAKNRTYEDVRRMEPELLGKCHEFIRNERRLEACNQALAEGKRLISKAINPDNPEIVLPTQGGHFMIELLSFVNSPTVAPPLANPLPLDDCMLRLRKANEYIDEKLAGLSQKPGSDADIAELREVKGAITAGSGVE